MSEMWIEKIDVIITNIYLFWGTLQDVRRKKISDHYLLTGGLAGIFFKIVSLLKGQLEVRQWVIAFLPGILFLVVAKITKEKIGMGDGLLLLILGNSMKLMEIYMLLQMAIIIVAAAALIMICGKKVSGDYQIPFLPFLWLSHILLWRLGYV